MAARHSYEMAVFQTQEVQLDLRQKLKDSCKWNVKSRSCLFCYLDGIVLLSSKKGFVIGLEFIMQQFQVDISQNQLEPEDLAALWKPLLSIVMEIEKIMEEFPGEFVKRLIACPYCEELVFTGEWLCPKELQNMASQICLSCQRDVATYFLIQPKEQTRADLIRQRLKELHKIKMEQFPNTEENAEKVIKL
ncbi:unnamed protein product [Acanthosepion pharaonis]|uniref:Uncharacterized protein n=1 Tax=Acanthosepion pharaonis TaxID=158019 RepID=A0A812CIN7_ACAPH|nr:unnamed protein product [Sepia pharaonis]